MSRLDEARQAWGNAVERMEDLDIQLQGLDDNTDPAIVETLEERFNEAKAEAERRRRDYQRADTIQASRSLTLPDGDDEPDGDADAPIDRAPGQITLERRSGRISVTKEPLTYEKHNLQRSFLADLARAKFDHDRTAIERLQRHARELQVERRDLSSTDGAGGEFVPPIWVMDEWIGVPRPGRPFSNAIGSKIMPATGDTFSYPKISTGSTTAAQADLGTVSETDPTTGSVTFAAKTIAGQVDISRQAVDRSAAPGLDQILFEDLRADYDWKIELQVITGSGSGANAKGVLSDSNRIIVAYTDASPTAGELSSQIANGLQQIHTNTFRSPNVIVMSPRRWGWLTGQNDTAGRPIVTMSNNLAGEQVATNPQALLQRVAAEGIVGIHNTGLPVLVSASIPTNLGAGTNEDVVLVVNTNDARLMEDPNPKTRVDESILSGVLGLRFQLWNYYAFSTERMSKSFASIGGTGLVTPVF